MPSSLAALILRATILVVVLITAAPDALGCSCANFPPEMMVERNSYIFEGRPYRMRVVVRPGWDDLPRLVDRYGFRVDRVWRGPSSADIEVYGAIGWSCSIRMRRGERVMIFENDRGPISAGFCNAFDPDRRQPEIDLLGPPRMTGVGWTDPSELESRYDRFLSMRSSALWTVRYHLGWAVWGRSFAGHPGDGNGRGEAALEWTVVIALIGLVLLVPLRRSIDFESIRRITFPRILPIALSLGAWLASLSLRLGLLSAWFPLLLVALGLLVWLITRAEREARPVILRWIAIVVSVTFVLIEWALAFDETIVWRFEGERWSLFQIFTSPWVLPADHVIAILAAGISIALVALLFRTLLTGRRSWSWAAALVLVLLVAPIHGPWDEITTLLLDFSHRSS